MTYAKSRIDFNDFNTFNNVGDAVTGGGLHGKDLSKADVSVNIFCHTMASILGHNVKAHCHIGGEYIYFYPEPDENPSVYGTMPYAAVVAQAREYIKEIGGFEKFAEWGLIR